MRWHAIIALSSAMLFSGAAAKAQPAASDRVLQSFTACRSMAEQARQLDCYNRATSTLEAAVRGKDVTIVDRTDVRKARRSLFGFTLPNMSLFGAGDRNDSAPDEDAFAEINTTVASARASANGRAEIRLADEGSAVWQTTDPMPFPPRAGERIRIRKGTLGNYFLSVGGRSYRGMRLR